MCVCVCVCVCVCEQAPVKLTRKEKMSEVKALYNRCVLVLWCLCFSTWCLRFVKAADSDDLAGRESLIQACGGEGGHREEYGGGGGIGRNGEEYGGGGG